MENRVYVHIEGVIPDFFGHLQQAAHRSRARRMDQYVDRPERPDSLFDAPGRLRGNGHIRRDRMAPPPERFNSGARFTRCVGPRIPALNGDISAGFRQSNRSRRANAARRAGHQTYFSIEIHRKIIWALNSRFSRVSTPVTNSRQLYKPRKLFLAVLVIPMDTENCIR